VEQKFLLQPGNLLPENVLWSFLLQLVSALRYVHALGLACRVVHPSKVLLTGKNRLRLNGVGVCDVLVPNDRQDDVDKALIHQQVRRIRFDSIRFDPIRFVSFRFVSFVRYFYRLSACVSSVGAAAGGSRRARADDAVRGMS
jgi:hypothetical protein